MSLPDSRGLRPKTNWNGDNVGCVSSGMVFTANCISGRRSDQLTCFLDSDRIRSSRVNVLCWPSHRSFACGWPGEVFICLMSAAVHSVVTTPRNSLPLSDRINSGTPWNKNQFRHSARITSAENLVRSGMNWTHRVHISTTVSTYRYPDGNLAPGLNKSTAMALNGVGANIGDSGTRSGCS